MVRPRSRRIFFLLVRRIWAKQALAGIDVDDYCQSSVA